MTTLTGCQLTTQILGSKIPTPVAKPPLAQQVMNASSGMAYNRVTEGAGFCRVAQVMTYSLMDTDETRAQILAHNCVGHNLCGWKIGDDLAKVCSQSTG